MENARLDAKERKLDELIEMANNELRAAHDDIANKKLAFVTYRDIRSVKEFSDQTVIAIKAPSETKLEVPDPREVCHPPNGISSGSLSLFSPQSLQIWLKSERGEIEVYLCPEDDGSVANSSDYGKGESLPSDLMSTNGENGENQENDGSKGKSRLMSWYFVVILMWSLISYWRLGSEVCVHQRRRWYGTDGKQEFSNANGGSVKICQWNHDDLIRPDLKLAILAFGAAFIWRWLQLHSGGERRHRWPIWRWLFPFVNEDCLRVPFRRH